MAFYAELLLFLSKTQFVFPAAKIQTLLVELFKFPIILKLEQRKQLNQS